jgi:hypothetical protein
VRPSFRHFGWAAQNTSLRNPVPCSRLPYGGRGISEGFLFSTPSWFLPLFLSRFEVGGRPFLPLDVATNDPTDRARHPHDTCVISTFSQTRCLSRSQSQNRSLLRHTSALSPRGAWLSAYRRGEQYTGEDVSDTCGTRLHYTTHPRPTVR